MKYLRPGLRSMLVTLSLVASPGAPLPAQNVYSGVWHPGTDGHAAWVTSDWSDFTSKWDDFNKSGLRMDDFEVYFEGTTPVYVGLFREGSGGHAAWVVTDWNDFTAKWAEFERGGLRMHDFETYVVNGTRWYAGIFREGTGGYAAWIVPDWNDFLSKWSDFEKDGLRMHDFETYVEGRTRWYAGMFREGSGGHAAWFTADWNDFLAKWTEFEKGGLQLVDFEFFLEGGTWTYGGIFRPGTGGHVGWFGVDWQNFTSFWHERGKEGWRLDDIEVFPSACSNTCMNQVVLPAPGFYDYPITGSSSHCIGLPGTCGANGGGSVFYRAPFYEEGGQRFVRLSAVNIEHQIFTLPFTDTDIKHNGWLYSPGSWHHAIDYYNGKNFDVRAAAPGEVIHVGWDWWSGNTVVLSHAAGGEQDRYRTIYMHLLNGAENDCSTAWSATVPLLSNPELTNYKNYLDNTNCKQNGAGTPTASWWGGVSDTIPVQVGDFVERGQVIAKAGSTGPGGCGCSGGGSGPNHHLHLFVAHRDPTNDQWYFIDPYGIYGPSECYPTRDDAEGASASTPCIRYPVAWLGGLPQLPTPPSLTKSFQRGDANADGRINLTDAVNILGCKFLGLACPECEDAADVNNDGRLDIADAVYELNCLFIRLCPEITRGGCVPDDAPDRLGCEEYQPCAGRGGED